MKILTKKQQDEILKILTANLVILHDLASTEKIMHYDKALTNTYDAAYLVGGFKGLDKVGMTFLKYLHEETVGEEHERPD